MDFRELATSLSSRKQFWERYHGWDLADVILDLGYVRPDGKTLIGQPALDLERLWTIEDIRRLKYAIKDPLLEQGRYLRLRLQEWRLRLLKQAS